MENKINIQVLSGEIVRLCLDTPKLFDACSLVESKIKEYSDSCSSKAEIEKDKEILELKRKLDNELNNVSKLEAMIERALIQ